MLAPSGDDDSCQPSYYPTYEEPEVEGSHLKVKRVGQRLRFYRIALTGVFSTPHSSLQFLEHTWHGYRR